MDELTGAADELTQHARELEWQATRYQELRARMTEVSVSETSADGRIGVTVDVNGATTAITLAPAVRGMDPAAVAAELMACTRRAQARLRGTVTGLIGEIVGTDTAADTIVEQYAERFPDPAPASPPAPSSTSAAPWPAPVAPAYPAPAPPATRKPDRDRVVTPDEPDEDDLYFQRRSWLQ